MSSSARKPKDTLPPRPACLGDPDVTVVVGGKVFPEQSRFLCCWSGYFEAAFRSGMKETVTRRFEFPDRDPEEWDWILSLLVPFSPVQLTLDKLEVALSWFDFLCISRGLERCDQVLHDAVLQIPLRTPAGFSKYLDFLSTSLQFNLPRSKAQYFQLVRAVFNRSPSYLHQEHLDTIALLIISHDECRTELWSLLEKYLPAPIADKEQQDCLLHTGALQSLVLTEIQKKHMARDLTEKKLQIRSLENQMCTLEERSESTNQHFHSTKRLLNTKNCQLRRIVAVMEQSSGNQTVNKLKRQLKSDSVCGHALPMRWSRREEERKGVPPKNKKRRMRLVTEDSFADEDDDPSVLFGMSSDESEMGDY